MSQETPPDQGTAAVLASESAAVTEPRPDPHLPTERTDVVVANDSDTAPPPKFTLGDILAALTQKERLLDAPDETFDALVIVGNLVDELVRARSDLEVRRLLEQKVDSISYVIEEFESYAERTAARAKRLAARAKAAENRAERLRTYIRVQMLAGQFERLPGVERCVELKRASTPALVLQKAEPTADDMLAFGENLVREIPASYEWKTKELKAALKGVKQGDGSALSQVGELVYSYSVKLDERDRPDVSEPKSKGKRK